MINISDYQNREVIYESDNSLVYRLCDITDNQPIIFKVLTQAYPPPQRIAQFQREYEITNELDLPGTIKVSQILETDDHRWAIVVEDFGGQSLDKIIQNKPLTLDEFLFLAIQVTQILGEVHQQRVIHKDINPSNIVWNRETNQVKLIDFGISTKLSQETTTFRNPNLLEGTLAYISPEQTGRMNRDVDYRSDFYSLGVTLYKLIVGQLPFETTDAMELVHSHIAKQPISPHEKKIEIPKVISNIVMKLMAKTAEERYQSAWGLKYDLETCQEELKTRAGISEFALGSKDISERFQISQKLYGRQEEVEQLLASFKRVSQGAAEIVLVAGYSGIGKSALVNEIHKPITEQKGYFISGKFDQFKRDIPYAALIQAFQELVRQLLTESETQLQLWKQKLLDALGKNGQVIVDVIPELELIIGKQPSVPQLGLTESQNRFNFVFQNSLGVFTQKEHPLVIFIDDLQWADLASLKLLELLMTDRDRQYLALMGAYRDNEVSPTHPLIQALERIQEQNTKVNTIALKPLELDWVNQLIADTLKCCPEKSKLLAQLAFEKTNGNPFFLTQLLQSLYAENLLSFTPSIGSWKWNIEQIQAVGITDNVVDLMASKIEKLESQTQNVLKLAACIGNRFDLAVLSVVNGKSISETAIDLWSALEQGLILPLSDAYKLLMLPKEEIETIFSSETSPISISYKFLHDRVQQAAYTLIPEAQKQPVHLQIGQLLLQNTEPDQLQDNIFDVVNQLNIGADLISAVCQRNELARLNLIAGKKAKGSTAYQAAVKYLNAGLELLTSDSWQDEYDMTLEIYEETIGAEYLNAELARAEQLAAVVLKQARTALDKVGVYEIQIHSYRSKTQFQEAIDACLEILAELGIVLPPRPSIEDIEEEERMVELLLKDKPIDDLANLPEMNDPHKLAAARLLLSITVSASIVNYSLYLMIIFSLVKLFVQDGNCTLSAGGYLFYGNYLSGKGDTNAGYEFGKLSLSLLDKFEYQQLRVMWSQIFNGFIRHWKDDARKTIDSVAEEINLGMENGDLEYVGYTAIRYSAYMFLVGENLKKVEIESEKGIEFTQKIKQTYSTIYIQIARQIALNLLGKSPNKYKLRGEAFDEEQRLPLLKQTNNLLTLFWLFCVKTILMYLFKKYNEAIQNSNLAEQYMFASAGMLSIAVYNFYDSLSLLSVVNSDGTKEREKTLEKVSSNQKRMKKWADNAPMNHLHKYDLVAAEEARVLGNNALAREYYDRAIEGAKKNGFIHEEAIAYERGAEFYFAIGREEIGQLYIKNAHYAYQRWGAVAKVEDLEQEYPELLRSKKSSTKDITTTNTTGTSSGEALDLATIIEASQAISGEIKLGALLEKLLKLAFKNSGAQKGILILADESEILTVEASGEAEGEIQVLQSIPVSEYSDLPMGIVNYVQRTKEDVVLSEATTEGMFTGEAYIVGSQPKSILCAAIVNQGKLLGILYLENNLATGAFTPDRLELLKVISAQAAISIENALLYRTLEQKVDERTAELAEANEEIQELNKQLESENLRMSAELDVTKQLQQKMLPNEKELLEIKELDIAGFMEPADEVGGDYYDVLQQDGKVKIGIGDVTGHGLESGMLMIMAQTATRVLLESDLADPVKFLDILNRTLCKNVMRMKTDKNMTLSILDYEQGTVTLSGQHEEMIIVRAGGHLEIIDTVDLGVPVGLDLELGEFFNQTQIELNSGDLIVLYTDGITEAENSEKEFYGFDRLCNLARENWQLSAADIREVIIEDVKAFIGEQKVYDDITLLAIKKR